MEFDAGAKSSEVENQIKQDHWNKMMKFIITQERSSFRNSLNSINNRLYLELNKMMKKDEKQRNSKELEAICEKLKFNKRASILITNFMKRPDLKQLEVPETIPEISTPQKYGKKKKSTLRKKDCPFFSFKSKDISQNVHGDLVDKDSINELLSSVEPERLLEMMNELRKLMEEPEVEKKESPVVSPLHKELQQFQNKKRQLRKRLLNNVFSPDMRAERAKFTTGIHKPKIYSPTQDFTQATSPLFQ